jgi:hypothetical protein
LTRAVAEFHFFSCHDLFLPNSVSKNSIKI